MKRIESTTRGALAAFAAVGLFGLAYASTVWITASHVAASTSPTITVTVISGTAVVSTGTGPTTVTAAPNITAINGTTAAINTGSGPTTLAAVPCSTAVNSVAQSGASNVGTNGQATANPLTCAAPPSSSPPGSGHGLHVSALGNADAHSHDRIQLLPVMEAAAALFKAVSAALKALPRAIKSITTFLVVLREVNRRSRKRGAQATTIRAAMRDLRRAMRALKTCATEKKIGGPEG